MKAEGAQEEEAAGHASGQAAMRVRWRPPGAHLQRTQHRNSGEKRGL